MAQRRLGPISRTGAGQPRRSWERRRRYLRGTRTTTGLHVSADRLIGAYRTGERVSDEDLDRRNLDRHAVCPSWTDTLRPRTAAASTDAAAPVIRDLGS